MAIARIEGGQIVEERPIALTDVPEHKRGSWLPFEGEPPTVDRALYVVTGPTYTIEPTRILQTWTVTPRDLVTVKANAKTSISSAAEAARGKLLTLSGPGKGMSYTKVAQEAATYVATQGAGAYPFLAARVASGRYANLADAAAGTLAIENATAMAAAAIDEIEDRAKLQIDAATTVEQVQAAATVTWP
jgi:hypothetical protein